jgi:glycosyltransferase involved in cell wall biosynthesis
MILYDVTKSAAAGHRSGLTRVNARLLAELGPTAVRVSWASWPRDAGPSDWFVTTEIFSPAERPGFSNFLASRACRCAAVYYDAIPLKHPHITWPASVARHPGYMMALAGFDRVMAISSASRDELLGYWRWQGIASPPPVGVLRLGADFDGAPRAASPASPPAPSLLCLGILEPRKNQDFLLDACEALWDEGLRFDLHVAGRVNPHFGRLLAVRIGRMRSRRPGLRYHGRATDAELGRLFAGARATVFPTIAEGSGLPLTESLWRAVPCVASDLPALREGAAGGGCLLVPPGDLAAWKAALRSILCDDSVHARLAAEAASRPLPTWSAAAADLQSFLTA